MNENGNNGRQQLEKELFIHCQSDLLSEEGIRKILERRGFITNDHDVSDYNFFLAACCNTRVTEGIIQCLLKYFPGAASATDRRERSPLHFACINPNVTLNIIKLIIDAAPASVRSEDNSGNMPLHYLCDNGKVDEAAALKVLKLLIENCPEAVRHADVQGKLPIHLASKGRSPEFCRLLIEAYPGSEQITDTDGVLPLHWACAKGSLATVEYLYRLFGDAIDHASTDGLYPLHYAIVGTRYRKDNPAAAVEIVQFLMDCDFDENQYYRGHLFHFACQVENNDSNIGALIQIIKALFDANPFAIDYDRISTAIQHCHQQVQKFVNGELVYARHGWPFLITPDDNGQLPLHRALQNNVRLGSIKLLSVGNPSAVKSIDNSGALPLHVACEHHDSTSVVEYLLGYALITRDAIDRDGNAALHYACRAKYDTIALLLEKYGAASVSKRNAHGKLPIDLLWESNKVSDRESVEYMGSVFQLLKAYPEIVMNYDTGAIQNQSVNGKKRKYE
jgi:ankyrin repeat protein